MNFRTILEYYVMPLNSNGAFVAVDLVFSDGRTLRDSGAVDQFGVKVHPLDQGSSGRLVPHRYHQVTSAIGRAITGTITQIVVGYDQPLSANLYQALIDDITFTDKSSVVPVKGRMVDESNQLFADPTAYVDPTSSSSTCGPTLAVQSKSSKACTTTAANPFVAMVPSKNFANLRLKARVPRGRDVLVSVCGKDANYECEDHPDETFCRPFQSTVTASISLYMPPTKLPNYVSIWWKYVPEAQAGLYPACDLSGHARRVSTAGLGTGNRGDVDQDTFLTVSDGIRLLRCANGISQSAYCYQYGDIDSDGSITSADAASVFRLAAGFPLCGPNCDTDGDAIPDRWEIGGYDYNGNGDVDVDLSALGARMFHQDIFVECDYMVAGDHTHRPLEQAIAMVVDAFAQAPVTNPDGTSGIRLHVDTGNLGGGEVLPHDDDLNPVGDEFSDIRNAHFAPARRDIFHYCVWGHNFDGVTNGGRSFGIPSDSFVVTLGSFSNQVGSLMNQASVFMHELGHNLGLKHGGFEDQNNKPNYLSVMNYSYAFGLIFNGIVSRVDFARFPVSPLNENALDEAQGLNTPSGDGPLAPYGCVQAVSPEVTVVRSSCTTNVDWDLDGNATEVSVSVDVNAANGKSTLQAYEDWQHIDYNGGDVGFGPPVSPNDEGPICITAEEAAFLEQSFAEAGVLFQPAEELE